MKCCTYQDRLAVLLWAKFVLTISVHWHYFECWNPSVVIIHITPREKEAYGKMNICCSAKQEDVQLTSLVWILFLWQISYFIRICFIYIFFNLVIMKWCTYQEGWYVLVCTYFLFDHLCHSLDSDSNNFIKSGTWLQYHWYDGHLAILSQMILPRKSVSWCHLRLCSDSFNSCQVPICQTSNSLFGTWLPLYRSTQWCTAWTHGHDASTHWLLEAVIVKVQFSNSCYRLMFWAIPLKLFSLVRMICNVWFDSEIYVKMLLDYTTRKAWEPTPITPAEYISQRNRTNPGGQGTSVVYSIV